MFPTLQDLISWAPPIDTHAFFVGLAMCAAGAIFLIEKRRRKVFDHRIAYIVLGALVGAAIFSRLGTWFQHLDVNQNLSLSEQMLYGNASILSGLFGAWLGVYVAKWAVKYPYRTGDMFAPAVALAMVIGRIGCLLTERPGTPTGGGWGITLDAAAAQRTGAIPNIGLHPSFVYEIAFHALAFSLLWFWIRHRDIAAGETLTLFIAGYAMFRFGVEFVRGNSVAWLGLTRPQLFLLITFPLLTWRLVVKARRGAFTALTKSPNVEGTKNEQFV